MDCLRFGAAWKNYKLEKRHYVCQELIQTIKSTKKSRLTDKTLCQNTEHNRSSPQYTQAIWKWKLHPITILSHAIMTGVEVETIELLEKNINRSLMQEAIQIIESGKTKADSQPDKTMLKHIKHNRSSPSCENCNSTHGENSLHQSSESERK